MTLPQYSQSPTYNPATGEGAVAVEFAVPSVTSANFDENLGATLAPLVQTFINGFVPNVGNPNPHMKYAEIVKHGYYVLDVVADSAQADYFFSEIGQVAAVESFGQGWYTAEGENHLRQASGPTPPKTIQDTPAPADPPLATSIRKWSGPATVLGVYPNPFSDINTLHYSLDRKSRVVIDLLDTHGKVVRRLVNEVLPRGIYTLKTRADALPAGQYTYRIQAGQNTQTATVIIAR